ncbi:DUF4347 domain-containing protein [Azospirillum rugosum]|uniref:DUF4347 domain-containing protein n=1 Tax=Azospirillum rugosum TaxID=416170 RepID=UPI00361FBB8B
MKSMFTRGKGGLVTGTRVGGTAAQPGVQGKGRKAPLAMALEPRFMFDAAGVATAASDPAVDQHADPNAAHPDNHDAATAQTDAAVTAAAAAAAGSAPAPAPAPTTPTAAPVDVRALDPTQNDGKKEVVFIESNVPDYQQLVDGVKPGVEVVVLDASKDGLAQMAAWAQTHSGYDAIHIISHGSEGQVNLGSLQLNSRAVADRSVDLAALGASLTHDGDILLYGCGVAQSTGQAFLTDMANATGADVAASTDSTGVSNQGGNWTLEASRGSIDANDPFLLSAEQQYDHLLLGVDKTFTFSSSEGTVGGSTAIRTWKVNIGGTEYTLTFETTGLGVGAGNASADFSYDAFTAVNGDNHTGGTGINTDYQITTIISIPGYTFDLVSFGVADIYAGGNGNDTDDISVSAIGATTKVTTFASNTMTFTPISGFVGFTGISSFTVVATKSLSESDGSGMIFLLDDLQIANIQAVAAPTVTDGNISIAGHTGADDTYKVGDTVTATWNNTSGGDNNSSIASVTVDFSQFGGGTAVAATNSSGTWTATYVIAAGSIDGTNKNVSVKATNGGGSTTTADTTNAKVDSEAPTVTGSRITLNNGSGTGNVFKAGDTVTATWDNTGSGDNNADLFSVTVDFSAFGGGAVMANSSSGTYTATYVVTAGTIDGTGKTVSVTATDNADNVTTTSSTTTKSVDNQAPTVTGSKVTLNTGTGPGGVFKVGDTVTATWDNTAATGDNNGDLASVTVNFSQFGGGTGVAATNSSGTWTATYTIVGGSVDGGVTVSVKATDDAGNTTTTTSGTTVTLDNQAPTVSDGGITLNGGSGPSGAFKIGDTVTATWNNTNNGDNNTDIASVTANFSQFGGGTAVAATNSSGVWTATYAIAAGSVDGTGKTVSVTATDDGGNTTTTPGGSATVDNIAPVVTDAKISISGGSGTGGAYKIGDTVTATWNNTGSGDNSGGTNGDLASVTVNFSAFGGGAAVAATNSSGTWTAKYTVTGGSVDGTNLNVSVTAVDDVGNTTTTTDGTNATFDNVAPTITAAKTGLSGTGSGTAGGFKTGDTVTATWNNTVASGDNNSDSISSVTVDFSAFGGGAAVAATNSSGTWTATYVIASGTVDGGAKGVTITAIDNAGNSATATPTTTFTVDNQSPTVTAAKISVSGGTGTGGAYKIGDTVTATWDNTGSGDNNADSITSVTVDFSQFGGGAAVAATNSSGTWTATYVIVGGSVDTTSRNVSVTATDNMGNSTTTADDSNVTVDNVAPTVTDAKVSISGGTGTGGAYKIGDTVTATWNNTGSGDNNADSITSATVDFSDFGGGTVAATNSSGTWTAKYTITGGSTDGLNRNVSVTATDNAGNTTTTADGTNATVDNVAPTVTDNRISITGATGAGGVYKTGDTVTATWDNTASGDNNADSIASVTVNFSQFGGGAAVAATNSSGTWTATYVITAGSIDASNKNVTVTVTDNAGNAASAADTTNASVNNVGPTVTAPRISISGASGTGGAYKIGDTVTAAWDNTASGDNNASIGSVTMDFSQFGGGTVAAANSSGTWTATYVVTAGSVDTTGRNVSVTATNSVGNPATTAGTTNATVDNVAPTVTDAKISISGGSGTGGAYKIGDTVTATWNNTVASGDNNSDSIASVTVNFSAFGGGTAVAATNSSGTWTATYVLAGSMDSTGLDVSVTATDNAGNTTTTADSTGATVDTIAPVVTDAKVSISGASGTGGAYKIGDTVTATWNNTAGGDNNADSIASVTVNFSQFGGGAAVAATNSSGTWTATYVITAASIDATGRNVSVTATDNAGNTTTTADTTGATVDNVAPTVTDAKVSISGASGTGGAYKIGDTVTATWNNTASGDNNADSIASMTVDFSQFGGGTVAATNSSGTWTATYVIAAGSVDTTGRNVSVTATDNAGNTTTTADTTGATVDNVAPTVTDAKVSISGASGTGGAYKIGDTVTATWNNTVASGDNNSDSIASVTVDFSQFGGGTAVAATNSSGTWTATYVIAAGSVDGTNKNVSVTATDNAGNTTTTAGTNNATVDNVAPTVTDAKISISGASGTGGAYKIGDTVTATWNNTVGGDNNSDSIASVTVNFSAFGGGTAVAATQSTATTGQWTATYVIAAGSIDATNCNVSVTATDNAGNTTTRADTTNATVDTVAPTVTDGNVSISGGTGTGGAYKIGDTVTATWNNTSGGDNNTDTISTVTVDFSAFGGGTAVAATQSTATAGQWTATYVIAAGSVDATNCNVSVTATDNAGNTTTRADSTNATVDNVAPTVTDAKVSISGGTGTGGAYKIGDTVTATWNNNTVGGDNNNDSISSVTVDFSAFGGGTAVAAANSSDTWTATYVIASGSVDGTNKNVSVTATDNAGNTTTTAGTNNATVDNVAPTVTDAKISISGPDGDRREDQHQRRVGNGRGLQDRRHGHRNLGQHRKRRQQRRYHQHRHRGLQRLRRRHGGGGDRKQRHLDGHLRRHGGQRRRHQQERVGDRHRQRRQHDDPRRQHERHGRQRRPDGDRRERVDQRRHRHGRRLQDRRHGHRDLEQHRLRRQQRRQHRLGDGGLQRLRRRHGGDGDAIHLHRGAMDRDLRDRGRQHRRDQLQRVGQGDRQRRQHDHPRRQHQRDRGQRRADGDGREGVDQRCFGHGRGLQDRRHGHRHLGQHHRRRQQHRRDQFRHGGLQPVRRQHGGGGEQQRRRSVDGDLRHRGQQHRRDQPQRVGQSDRQRRQHDHPRRQHERHGGQRRADGDGREDQHQRRHRHGRRLQDRRHGHRHLEQQHRRRRQQQRLHLLGDGGLQRLRRRHRGDGDQQLRHLDGDLRHHGRQRRRHQQERVGDRHRQRRQHHDPRRQHQRDRGQRRADGDRRERVDQRRHGHGRGLQDRRHRHRDLEQHRLRRQQRRQHRLGDGGLQRLRRRHRGGGDRKQRHVDGDLRHHGGQHRRDQPQRLGDRHRQRRQHDHARGQQQRDRGQRRADGDRRQCVDQRRHRHGRGLQDRRHGHRDLEQHRVRRQQRRQHRLGDGELQPVRRRHGGRGDRKQRHVDGDLRHHGRQHRRDQPQRVGDHHRQRRQHDHPRRQHERDRGQRRADGDGCERVDQRRLGHGRGLQDRRHGHGHLEQHRVR